jgi:hypothetical protein
MSIKPSPGLKIDTEKTQIVTLKHGAHNLMTTECHRRRGNPRKHARRWIMSGELAK